MKNYDFVLWDWNGTLLDDLEANLEIVDVLLKNHGLKKLESREFYLENFGFPIVNFYKKLGFDLSREDFMTLADEYDEEYLRRLSSVSLFKNTRKTLSLLSEAGVKQAVISATEHGRLVSQIEKYSLSDCFDAVLGTENHLGKGKTDVALEWLKKSGADPKRTVFVGDTLHDFDCARAIGCDCFLISNGHNSRRKLLESGCEVFSDISEVGKRVLEG